VSPDTSIVIVTWNGRQYLDDCLTAAQAQHGADAEIVLVDNGSSDGTPAHVQARFPGVRVVALGANHGFAGGCNIGAREARGAYVAFLNNDTIADPGWLRALRAGVDPASRSLLVTSRVVYMHDPNLVDSAGDGAFRWGGAYKRLHGQSVERAALPQEVFGVCGAACLMPKTVFEELGGFDEDFFASHEDVDLSYRARLRGYRCRYVPDAIVRHHGSASIGTISRFAVFQGQRNLEWVFLKNTPGSLLLRTLPGHLLYNAAAAAHFTRLGLLGTFLKAKAAAVAALPAVMRKRTAIQASALVGSPAIEEHLDRGWLTAKVREKRFDVGLAEQAR